MRGSQSYPDINILSLAHIHTYTQTPTHSTHTTDKQPSNPRGTSNIPQKPSHQPFQTCHKSYRLKACCPFDTKPKSEETKSNDKMSGSGGFYKYRCKYFYTYNCTNWVYVSQAPCANCLVSSVAVESLSYFCLILTLE